MFAPRNTITADVGAGFPSLNKSKTAAFLIALFVRIKTVPNIMESKLSANK